MNTDPYAICRYVQHYQAKNGYAPRRAEVCPDEALLDKLGENGVLEFLPFFEGGQALGVVLTEKGLRMANARRAQSCIPVPRRNYGENP